MPFLRQSCSLDPKLSFINRSTDHCGVCIDKGVAGVRCSLLTRVLRRRHDRAKSDIPLEHRILTIEVLQVTVPSADGTERNSQFLLYHETE